jgi:hypothetical protein
MKAFITRWFRQWIHTPSILLGRGDEVMEIDNFATGRREHLLAQDLCARRGSIADKTWWTG